MEYRRNVVGFDVRCQITSAFEQIRPLNNTSLCIYTTSALAINEVVAVSLMTQRTVADVGQRSQQAAASYCTEGLEVMATEQFLEPA